MKFFIHIFVVILVQVLLGLPPFCQSTINGNNSNNEPVETIITKLKTQVARKLKNIQESLNQVHEAKAETETRLNGVEGKMSNLFDQIELKERRINYLESEIKLTGDQNDELIGNLSSTQSQISSLSEQVELLKDKSEKQEELILKINATSLGEIFNLMKRTDLIEDMIENINSTLVGGVGAKSHSSNINPVPVHISEGCQFGRGHTFEKSYECRIAIGRLIYQTDGNLVVYDGNNHPKWNSETAGIGHRLVFQTDGNLVMYKLDNKPAWNSETRGRGDRLIFQSDRNFVIYDVANQPVWDARSN